MRTGRKLAQEVGADLETAGAAQRLNGHGAPERYNLAVRAEQHGLHGFVVNGDTVDRQVSTRRRALGDFVLGALDAFEQRYLAVIVGVDAYAEIHFVLAAIGVECFGHAENGIARREFDGREQRACEWSIHGGSGAM